MGNILLISEQHIKENSLLEINVNSKILSRTILQVQFIYLRQILGDTLYNNVLNDVKSKSDDASYTMKYKELLEDYIQPYLIQAVLQDWIINSTYKLTNKGVLKFNDTSANSISSDEIEYAKNYYDNRTTSYKAVLIKYLQENKLIKDCNTDRDTTSEGIGWYLEC